MATQNNERMGKTKNTTDNLIDDAISSQKTWLKNRSSFAKEFFTSLNAFAKPSNKKTVGRPAVKSSEKQKTTLRAHWFMILCVFGVILITMLVLLRHIKSYDIKLMGEEPVTEIANPAFGNVCMVGDGFVMIAGKWRSNTGVSVFMNDNLIATIMTDENGDFVYRVPRLLDSGNYTFYLMDADSQTRSKTNVFVYVSEPGVTHSELILPKHKLRINVQTVKE